MFAVFQGPREGVCSGFERWGDLCPGLDVWRWFGDGSSKAAVSTWLGGGVAVGHCRTGVWWFAEVRLRGEWTFPGWDTGCAERLFPGREVCGRTGFSPGEPYPGREVRGRTGLYKAGLGGWTNSVCLDSDWVTPLRISPQTCTGLLTTDFAVSTAVRRAGSLPVCLCYSSLGTIYQQAQPDKVLTVLTVFFSSLGPNVDCACRGLPLL